MSWWDSLFRRPPALPPELQQRLQAWQALPAEDTSLAHGRFVVVDVESSGLDPHRDRLLAIGAVAVCGERALIDGAFEIVLQQSSASSKANILVHGIGAGAQMQGAPPAEALLAFLEYTRKAPLVAFHAGFDQIMLTRALRQILGLRFKHDWLDLAFIAPALNPSLARKLHSLDDWTRHFGLSNYARHNALADSLCTAELFLLLSHQARLQKALDFRTLRALEQSQIWLSRSGAM